MSTRSRIPAEDGVTTPALVVPAVGAEDALSARVATRIDLRSPREFAEDHLPGAVNVPLFDDLERALIGTLYRRSSPQDAFEEGVHRTREKVAALVGALSSACGWECPSVDLARLVSEIAGGSVVGLQRRLEERPGPLPDDAVVLNCWRGGMRSSSVVALLRRLGLERAVVLKGGYKAYRTQVRAELDAFRVDRSFVLRGLTGVGKTLVLRALEEVRPGWTIDLEGAAGHRSSILGMVGLEPVTQKAFDSALAERVRAGFPADLAVFEGESRKVGDVTVPDALWRELRTGTPLELVASTARRVAHLTADYLATEDNRAPLARQLPFIEERLGANKWRGVLVDLLERGRDAELVEILLRDYYDPLYEHSEKRFLAERAAAGLPAYAARFEVEDPQAAARAIVAWIEARD